jgi:hypothetical protein
MYLPEKETPAGPPSPAAAEKEAHEVWSAAAAWFAPENRTGKRRAAVLRFHRFLPGVVEPVVSHWTTVCRIEKGALHLHDASSDNGALHALEQGRLMPGARERALLRIVPESLLLLERVE